MIANVNAHGGVNGRKIVPYLVAVNPTGTTATLSTCTQLTENDHVFVVLGPEQVDCYVSQHHTPAINGLMETAAAGSAANFTLQPPFATYDPLQLSLFNKKGKFKGKKVGLFAGTGADKEELTLVGSELKKLHVNVVENARVSDTPCDQDGLGL